jgi:lipopolysaccharide transport system ATP-binding protein
MSKPIIEVSGLSKSYIISHEGTERYTALRDVVARKAKKIFSFPGWKPETSVSKEEFWALKDVNFEIEEGDRIGIIGRNGAGKSTLLKILSRITEPTSGEIKIKGRVASLLEVGTGFHPELTGRENIFLNGAILGMSRVEIKKHFDAIVDFAEIEKFLDTPVKRYSSGMYVRLAFAVAAHLEPEILVVDEVLAVGDAQFQKKCLGKMEDVSKNEGRTVMFVSHNMTSISTLCNSGILLHEGGVISRGDIHKVIENYSINSLSIGSKKVWDLQNSPGNEIVRLLSVTAVDKNINELSVHDITEPIGVKIQYKVLEAGHILWHGINFYNEDGINIFDSHSVTSKWYYTPHPLGEFETIAWVPPNLLNEGRVIISVAIFNHTKHVLHLHTKEVIVFDVCDYQRVDAESARGHSVGRFPGTVRPLLNWTT